MEVVIHYFRPGRETSHYIEGLVFDDGTQVRTMNRISPEISQQWCVENWWPNGYIPKGFLIGSEAKFMFYREWFSVLQLLSTNAEHLGYYVDITTPVHKENGEYFLTDLFLDIWIAPDRSYIELDRDELNDSNKKGLITPYQSNKVEEVAAYLKKMIKSTKIFDLLV